MTETSQFDPDSFLDGEIQGALDTQLIPVPDGEWPGTVKEVTKPRHFVGKPGTANAGKDFYFMDVVWTITDPAVIDRVKRDAPTVRQTLSLDLTPGGDGRLVMDMGPGKNVGLGALRDVFDMNDANQPFAPRMLQGRAAKLQVKQRTDPTDSTRVFTDVKKVSKLAL